MKGTIEIGEPEVKQAPRVNQRAIPAPSLERLVTAPAQVRPIFADSLLQHQGQKGRQTWATLVSFAFQCLLVGVLLLVPLYFTPRNCPNRNC